MMRKLYLGAVLIVGVLFGCGHQGAPAPGGQTETKEKKIQDSRVVGRAVDIQGLVSVRSVNETRWRPLTNRQLIAPGDWIRCDNRGPNAMRMSLPGGGSVILGPGSVVECATSAKLSLISGELEVTPGEDQAITVTSGDQSESYDQLALLRVKDGELTRLKHEPSWLQGFKGTVVNESMGSLLVKVDGRDVPLTVGYHKVTIDIRDQIARTVIEESFVNHTRSRLEGIFHFPLPADASISEFGMWIGDELVRADVVEKQRAREIYETILRERRDPGLLEWAGGNMFKARVFPIFPHSEKRVTITYTQVLPMRDGIYRYTYPLQSDMLRQNPLRELQLTTTVSSAAPLKSVECTSHQTRQRMTKHAASVEFTAQEYTPTRDFEIAITPKMDDTPITVVPHQRGEDGYFLMLLNARSGEHVASSRESGTNNGQRTTDNGQLKLVFLADTSGSMDAKQRDNQADFLRTMMTSLGPKDQFALFACDVDCVALSDGMVGLDAADVALDALAARDSLGWTNLDNAFATVLENAPAGAHIIYVGDGIQATSDIDPVAAARRLKALCARSTERGAGMKENRTSNIQHSTSNTEVSGENPKSETPTNDSQITAHDSRFTVHTVATGSAYEAVIMKALASAGGGSFREMQGNRAPVTAAAELLHELTHPGLRDLSVEFKGIRTACVYPQDLPNLAAGMQQIITGRYLPSGTSGKAEVIVRGKLGDKPVEYSVPVTLPTKNEEPGTTNEEQAVADSNSFIPRLWARRHLDVLLEQGASPQIKEQIVGFSQAFKIMTPYTSFLVLESDEDRERFGVKRHFKMRDGEAFFAEGKDSAKYELTRQQMLAAAQWRMDLRRRLIHELKDLGRVYPVVPQPTAGYGNEYRANFFSVSGAVTLGVGSAGFGPGSGMDMKGGAVHYAREESWAFGGGRDSRSDEVLDISDFDGDDDFGGEGFFDEDGQPLFEGQSLSLDYKADKEMVAYEPAPVMAEMSAKLIQADYGYIGRQSIASSTEAPTSLRLGGRKKKERRLQGWGERGDRGNLALNSRLSYARKPADAFSPDLIQDYWLNAIFPTVGGPAPRQTEALPDGWSQEVKDLLTGLLRHKRLDLDNRVLRIRSDVDRPTADDAKPSAKSHTLTFWEGGRWLQDTVDVNGNRFSSWLADNQRGRLDHTYMAVRLRDSQDGDVYAGFPDFGDGGKNLLGLGMQRVTLSVRKKGETVELAFRPLGQDHDAVVLVIDPNRKVLLERRSYGPDGVASFETFTDFAEVASVWWPGKSTRTDQTGKVVIRKNFTIEALPRKALEQAFADLAKTRKPAVELPQPLPLPTVARRNVKKDNGDIADYASLVSHAVALQKWDDVHEHGVSLFNLIGDLPARPWMEISLNIHSRRNEEARKLLETLAENIAASAKGSEAKILFKPARQLISFANSAMQVNERLVLLDSLKQLYQSGDAFAEWRQTRIGWLQQAGQLDQALVEARQFHKDEPDNATAINLLTSLLVNNGETAEAYALLDEKTGQESRLPVHSRINLCNHWLNLLQNQQSERTDQKDVLERLFSLTESLKQANEYNYRRYLSVLFAMDPEGIYEEQMNQWLDISVDSADEKLQQINLSKLQAGVNMALGNSYDGRMNVLDPEWVPDLVRIVKAYAGHENAANVVNQIMSNHRFKVTEEAADLRAAFAKELQGDISAMDIPRLIQRTQWIQHAPPPVEKEQWQIILDNLTGRWEKLPKDTDAEIVQRHSLGETIVNLTNAYLGLDAAIVFSRQRLATAPESRRQELEQKHFNLLTSGPWREDYEQEAFALLPRLCKDDDEKMAETTGIHALMILTDWMVDGRIEAGLKEEELAGKLQNMDRKTKWQLEQQLEADARLAATASLARQREELPEILQPWAGIEILDLQTRLLNAKTLPAAGIDTISARDVVAELREALGPQAPAHFSDGNELLLFRRRLSLAQFWTVRGKGIDKATRQSLAQFLVDYCGRALARAPEEPVADEKGFTSGKADWRQVFYDLLVMLDQARELEKRLQNWAQDADGDRWRIPLAYLLAATDRIGGAIVEMERAESAELLGPADYRALSAWYQVVDDKAKHIAARRKALEQMPEHVLSNRIYQERNRTRRSDWNPADGVPPEIDIDTIVDHFIVLFRKSQHPSNYIWQLRDIYTNTRDFRLLRCVPEGIVGMSAQQVYPMLNNLRQVLNEIRDEAVVDEFHAAILGIRGQTTSTVDARALLLLEAEIMRRASEVLNQPGQHTPKALAALQAAFKKADWGPGEPRLMADFLANLGRISQEPLAVEQRRQLKILHEQAEAGTLDCLHICASRARILGEYSQWDEAIALLEAELALYRQANGGKLIANANFAMDQLVGYCEGKYRFVHAEKLLQTELERPANRNQWRWLRQRLYQTYNASIRHKGTTSLGSGKQQYDEACRQLVVELLSEKDYNHARDLVRIQCDIFRSARQVKIDSLAEDVVRFAMQHFPEMAVPGQQYIYQYHNSVGTLAETVEDLASRKAGIAFLLAVAEREPPGHSYGYQSFWGQHAYRLADWRRHVKDLGELEKPLLDLVCRELRRHLETGQSYRQDMYFNNHSYFWGEKADVFAQVAEGVLAEHPGSGKVAYQVGYYFYEGLDRYDRGIEVLAAAYKEELLDENAQSFLAQCLYRQHRHAEAVPVLEHLVDWRPDALGYRTRLMLAYHGAQRPEDVERCRAAADEHFRQPKFWNENVAYQLGSACRSCQLDTHAVVYLEDAIALHRKARNDRIQGDHQISNYYYELAEAYGRLGETSKAVDAASGAIVCWGRDIKQRRQAVSRLTDVLTKAKDLDTYMASVDAEADKTGLENPVLRKAAGLAYDNRAEPQKAIGQYVKALETQPNDVDTHANYVKLLQQLSQKEALPEALLAWHRAAPHDASVIKQLQQAYENMMLPEQAERAATMLVESQPLEAEAHQALAELRQQHNRWEEAVPHWQRVAELRELEPTGLMGLVKAQIHLKRTAKAEETIQKLLGKEWPERFGNVHDQARRLLKK